jgi:hypothetical protein
MTRGVLVIESNSVGGGGYMGGLHLPEWKKDEEREEHKKEQGVI